MSQDVAPRKLRVLLVDDVDYPGAGSVGERTLGTDDLDVLEFSAYRPGREAPYLKRWEDHLEFWRTAPDDRGRPDLLVIDCHFDRDHDAPELYRADDGEEAADPRGLLHGVIQVARLLGMHPWYPFGFVIYSQDLPKLATDAYAVTLFGLLEAMSGGLPPFDPARSAADLVRERMQSHHRGGHPRKAWPNALQQYRTRLADAFENLRFVPDLASFHAAQQRLDAFSKGAGPAPDERASVKWASNWGEDEVLLRSLFADCRSGGRWDAEAVAELCVEWLHDTTEIDRKQRVCNLVTSCADVYRKNGHDPAAWQPLDELKGDGLLHAARGLALTLLWTLRWTQEPHNRQRRTPTALQTDLGITEATQSKRAVQLGLGLSGGPQQARWSLDTYLRCLESLQAGDWPMPLPTWVREEVRSYLRHRLQLDERKWPACFRDQGSGVRSQG